MRCGCNVLEEMAGRRKVVACDFPRYAIQQGPCSRKTEVTGGGGGGSFGFLVVTLELEVDMLGSIVRTVVT